jgi:hypothetical protein
MPVHEGGMAMATVVCVALSWVYERLGPFDTMDDDDDAVGVDGKMDDDVADGAKEEALGWGSTRTGMGLRVQRIEGRVF